MTCLDQEGVEGMIVISFSLEQAPNRSTLAAPARRQHCDSQATMPACSRRHDREDGLVDKSSSAPCNEMPFKAPRRGG